MLSSQVIQDEDNRVPDVTFSDIALRFLDAALKENWCLPRWTHPDELTMNPREMDRYGSLKGYRVHDIFLNKCLFETVFSLGGVLLFVISGNTNMRGLVPKIKTGTTNMFTLYHFLPP